MVRRLVLFGLLAVGLLVAGGFFGWSGGYTAGLAAEGGIGPYAEGGAPLFLGVALLFKFLLVLFVALLIGKLLFFWRKGPYRGRRGHRRHWHEHGHGWPHEEYGPSEDDDDRGTPQVA